VDPSRGELLKLNLHPNKTNPNHSHVHILSMAFFTYLRTLGASVVSKTCAETKVFYKSIYH